jgi:hypothetical protein
MAEFANSSSSSNGVVRENPRIFFQGMLCLHDID